MKWKLWRRRQPSDPHQANGGLRGLLPDASPQQLETIRAVRPYTMTSPERILALIRAVEHIVQHDVPGDLVECGVWRGGSVMAMILTLQALKAQPRTIWLYDTFEGMSPPTAGDVDFRGNQADQLLAEQSREDPKSIWCYSGIDTVRHTLASTGYPEHHLNFVAGAVESTLLAEPVPQQIAMLRLDTDWYESTLVELQVLFPGLSDRGVLIIDDYGHWQGCRRAVDEFFAQQQISMFLHRIDYTGRMGIHHLSRRAA